MDHPKDRTHCILCTCEYTSDGKYLPSLNPIVVLIHDMTLNQMIITNGYKWMKRAGLIWLTVPYFVDLYGKASPELIRLYDDRRVDLVNPTELD